MKRYRVLLVDDKENIREVLGAIVSSAGYEVELAESGERALDIIRKSIPHVVLSDVKMPGISGIDLVQEIHNIDSSVPVIMITAFGSITSAVEAMKAGAFDYLTKPLDYDVLLAIIKKALEQKPAAAVKEVSDVGAFCDKNIIGESAKMQKMFDLIRVVSPSNSSVLIQGEWGTGKELIARSVHNHSRRSKKRLVVVDCASLPENLLESELFGYVKGAFTGADKNKPGRILSADGGTLFLDEIGEMSPVLQAKLLRVIQEKKIMPLGGLEPVSVDFRLIAATNRDLKAEVQKGSFRADLYYRLNVVTIEPPPLRERQEDIPLLARFFVKEFCRRDDLPYKELSHKSLELLMAYEWPGNVRELENCMERLVVVSPGDILDSEYLPPEISGLTILSQESLNLDELEKRAVVEALEKAGGNKTEAARLLNIGRKALYNKLEKYHLK